MNSSIAHEGGRHAAGPVRLPDRVLAEAVRARERDGAALLDEPEADAAGRAAGGDLESRIVRRAGALSVAPALREAVRQTQSVSAWIVGALVVLAVVTGAGAVRAALGPPGASSAEATSVNVFWVLLSLLGVQSVLLVAWLILMIARPGSTHVSPLGRTVLALARWVAGRTQRGPDAVAALQALGVVKARGVVGRWTFSAISHALWTGANAGALVLLIVLLSTKQYVFHWETTILSASAYESITRAFAALPTAVGFAAPTPEQVAATEAGVFGGPGGEARSPEAARAWSGMLVGCLAVYGFAPRLLLLGLSLNARGRAARRFRLDPGAPGYALLRARLMPVAEGRGVVPDGPTQPPAPAPVASAVAAPDADGPPAIFGLELEPPDASWPPPLHAVRWTDLGFVDGREDRQRLLVELAALTPTPRMTLVVCTLTTTPDRGLGSFVGDVVAKIRGPVALLLTGGDALRDRARTVQVTQRVADWRALAVTVGVDESRVREIDLDHLTDATRASLAELIGGDAPAGPGAGRQVEPAFALIAAAVRAWPAGPDTGAQAALQKDIAGLYRHEATGLRTRLGLDAADLGDVAGLVKGGATRFVALLPDRLKDSPKWLAAGAIAGALGCVALGTLLTPAAFAALPAWTMGGAGLGGLLRMVRGGGAETTDDEADPDSTGDAGGRRDAVRAAVLFTLVLERQGHGEADIARLLDRTLDDGPAAEDADACVAWLDEIRHRFDLALAGAGETGS